MRARACALAALLILPLASPAAELTPRDQIRVAVQKICPISGNKLGEHGQPVKVKVGQETVFLCCQSCLESEIDPKHWATIHANFAKAQRICPVMKHELPDNPKWTIVDGQIVYICCPPCAEKLRAAPEEYLPHLDRLYQASVPATNLKR